RRLCLSDECMGDCHWGAAVRCELPAQHPAWPMAYGACRGGLCDLGLPSDHLAVDRGRGADLVDRRLRADLRYSDVGARLPVAWAAASRPGAFWCSASRRLSLRDP